MLDVGPLSSTFLQVPEQQDGAESAPHNNALATEATGVPCSQIRSDNISSSHTRQIRCSAGLQLK